ncbi:MAG: fibro-slime domain-containing protein [Eubacteriales bacterium]|nr:fibro-slime domain-containing protein [Eubacteriales bacterium]
MSWRRRFRKGLAAILAVAMLSGSMGSPRQVEAEEAGDYIVLPLQLIDYRADNLLFQYAFDGQADRFDLTEEDLAEKVSGAQRTEQVDGVSGPYMKGLVETRLGEGKMPVYRREVVDYVANLVREEFTRPDAPQNTAFYQQLKHQILGDDFSEEKILLDWSYFSSKPTEGNAYWRFSDMAESDSLYPQQNVENYDHQGDIRYVAGENPVSLESQLFEAVAAKYTVICHTGKTKNFKIVFTGYNGKEGTEIGEIAIGETDSYGEMRFEFSLTDEMAAQYENFTISYVPTQKDAKLHLGNNWRLQRNGDEILDSVENRGTENENKRGWPWLIAEGHFVRPGTAWNEAWGGSGPGASTQGNGDLYKVIEVSPGREYQFELWYTGIGCGYQVESVVLKDGIYQTQAVLTSGSVEEAALPWWESWKSEGVSFTVPAGVDKIKLTVSAANIIENDDNHRVGLGTTSLVTYSSGGKDILGSYEASAQKSFTREEDITTCYDYAYYMLNHFFDPDNILGKADDTFNTLELAPIEDSGQDGTAKSYGFYGNFDNDFFTDSGINNYPIDYDLNSKIIKNNFTGSMDQPGYMLEGRRTTGFFPLSERVTRKTLPAGWEEMAATANGIGITENFHYAMVSSGKFVYHESDHLFFEFTGDDDVYLFINNRLAIDIGGAHLAAHNRIELNSLAEELELEEGGIYDFDFFYLERHTDYANLRVITNIKILEPGALVSKTAYDETGKELPTGSTVAAGTTVYYALKMTNTGNNPIKNLHFVDEMLGIDMGGAQKNQAGDIVANDPANYKLGPAGQEYDLNKLTVTVNWIDQDTNKVTYGQTYPIENLDNLAAVLEATSTQLNYGGYTSGSEIIISGFAYTVPDDSAGIIRNIVKGDVVAATSNQEEDVIDAGTDTHLLDVKMRIRVEYYLDEVKDGNYLGSDYIDQWEGQEIAPGMQIALQDGTDSGNLDSYRYNAEEMAKDKTAAYNENIAREENKKGNRYGNPEIITVSGGMQWDRNADEEQSLYTVSEGENVIYVVYRPDVEISDAVFVLDYAKETPFEREQVFGAGTVEGTQLQYDELDTLNMITARWQDKTRKAYISLEDIAGGNTADGTKTSSSMTGQYGTLKCNTDYSGLDYNWKYELSYVPQKVLSGIDTFNVNIRSTAENESRDIEKVKTVKIIPANNVYYEDTFVTDESGGTVGIVYTGKWTTVKEENADLNEGRVTQDIHGGWQDIDLNDEFTYSDGSAHKADFADGAASATFTFTGTGVDIYSRTDMTTGSVLATLYEGDSIYVNGTDGAKKVAKKAMIVDNLAVSAGEDGYYQIPTVFFDGLDYGTYTLRLVVSSTTAVTGTKRSVYYLDGIRVYNPIQNLETDSVVADAYGDMVNASFTTVRSLLLAQNEGVLGNSAVVFIDKNGEEKTDDVSAIERNEEAGGGSAAENAAGDIEQPTAEENADGDAEQPAASENADGDTEEPSAEKTDSDTAQNSDSEAEASGTDGVYFSLETGSQEGEKGDTTSQLGVYEEYGPKNEVYLAAGNSIAFRVADSGKKYFIGLKAPESRAARIQITNGEQKSDLTIGHAADLYYEVRPDANGYVMIANTGDSLLAVTKICSAGSLAALTQEEGEAAVTVRMLLSYADSFESLSTVPYENKTLVSDGAGEDEFLVDPETPAEDGKEENKGDVEIINPGSDGEGKDSFDFSRTALAVWIDRLFAGLRVWLG